MFEQAIQLQSGRQAALHILPQSYWVDGQQAALDSVEEKRNDPAANNDDDRGRHAASSNAFVVFSSKTSSILLRAARRTVIERPGISSFVPEDGTYPSRVKTNPPMVSIPSASI